MILVNLLLFEGLFIPKDRNWLFQFFFIWAMDLFLASSLFKASSFFQVDDESALFSEKESIMIFLYFLYFE